MSKRLQVLIADEELTRIRHLAEQENLSVGEWVRRTLSEARSNQSLRGPGQKLKALREATAYTFSTAGLDQMLSEIEKGYTG
jgi:hypothetical protein